MNCDAVQMLTKCPATLSSGAAYFDKFADCPLLCQYGEIGGLPASESSNPYMLKPKIFLAVQDAFKGGMVIQHMETALDQTRYANPDVDDPIWKEIRDNHRIRWDTRVVRCWYFLIAPNYPPWETHEGDQADYHPEQDYYTDDEHVEKYAVFKSAVNGQDTYDKKKYLMPTKWLAT